jgi:uncharacterized Zn finger protein
MTAVIPSRESAATRARRLLIEGRVAILSVHRQRVFALVRGDSGTTHQVVFTRNHWSCTCPARTKCAHVGAVQLVVDLERLDGSDR